MCLREIIHVKKNKDIIMVFSLLRISLKQIVYLRSICKRWKLAIDTIIGVLKSLHLKIGYQRWTSIERRLISIHWKEFTGHSRLMVQAIRAMVGVSDITDMIRHYRTSKRTTNCTYLFCHAECTEDINVYDIMDLLSCFPSAQILDIQEMESWVGQIILKIKNEWLLVLIPWLLQPFNPPSKALQRLIANNLLPRICDDIEMTYRLYFSCNFLIETMTDHSIYYTSIINRLLQMSPYKEDIKKSHEFLAKLKYPNEITDYYFDKIRLPFDPKTTIRDVQVVNIIQLNTFTKPWVVPIETHERGTIRILIKHDDIRKDKFVMDIIHMMKYVDDDIRFNTFHVLPISDTYGIIEMLNNSVTLEEINKTTTLTNWIVKNNISKPMIDIRNEFILSCASNCILTFMLGVGDRNLGNIMVSSTGHLAHIDFSYILGTDPKWEELTEMRITPGMVDLLGGIQSEQYDQLKIQCTKMFSNIKKYTYFWYALFRYLGSAEPPMEPHYRKFDTIELHVEKRLMPEATEEIVSMTIRDIVDKNSGSKIAGWVDSIHSMKSSLEDLIFNISIT
tara:strand:- start:3109 stop:4794 length:1686 start_codon:yes stop_codon:yes gene_type:complete